MNSHYLNFTKTFDNVKLSQASSALSAGKIGIFPTDTVYGIGCNAFLENSILKLFEFKNRTFDKPICVLISDLKMLDELAVNITDIEYKLIKAFWPGPLTIIFNKNPKVSKTLTSNLDTIGIRMPDHKITQKLIEYAKVPIATTSANISDMPAAINFSDISKHFDGKVDFIIDNGPSQIGIASTIVKIENNSLHILRKGSISEDMIKKVLERS